MQHLTEKYEQLAHDMNIMHQENAELKAALEKIFRKLSKNEQKWYISDFAKNEIVKNKEVNFGIFIWT